MMMIMMSARGLHVEVMMVCEWMIMMMRNCGSLLLLLIIMNVVRRESVVAMDMKWGR